MRGRVGCVVVRMMWVGFMRPSGDRAHEKLKSPNREFSMPSPPSFLVYSTVGFFLSLDEDSISTCAHNITGLCRQWNFESFLRCLAQAGSSPVSSYMITRIFGKRVYGFCLSELFASVIQRSPATHTKYRVFSGSSR